MSNDRFVFLLCGFICLGTQNIRCILFWSMFFVVVRSSQEILMVQSLPSISQVPFMCLPIKLRGYIQEAFPFNFNSIFFIIVPIAAQIDKTKTVNGHAVNITNQSDQYYFTDKPCLLDVRDFKWLGQLV